MNQIPAHHRSDRTYPQEVMKTLLQEFYQMKDALRLEAATQIYEKFWGVIKQYLDIMEYSDKFDLPMVRGNCMRCNEPYTSEITQHHIALCCKNNHELLLWDSGHKEQ